MGGAIRCEEFLICASYGLDPRFDDREFRDALDAAVLEGIRAWASGNEGETLRPTGKNLRNLNPIVTSPAALELAWWGYLAEGAPAKFPSINTRSERLSAARSLPERAIVPATFWREMTKPSRVWHRFTAPHDSLLGLAAVTRPGRTTDGVDYTCYSILMQPAARHLAHIHDRMPLLIAPGFAEEWLATPRANGELIDAAIAAAIPTGESIHVTAEV